MSRSVSAFLILLLAACGAIGQNDVKETVVGIAISPEESTSERIAAEELSGFLGKVYPDVRFAVAGRRSRQADQTPGV